MFPLGLIQHYWFHHSVSIKHSLYDLVAFYTEPASYEREPASMRHRITKKLVQTKATTFSFFAGSSCKKAHVCAGACFCLASDWAAQALLVAIVQLQHLPEPGWAPPACAGPGWSQRLLSTLAMSWYPGVPVSAFELYWYLQIFQDWILEGLMSRFGLLNLMASFSSRVCSVLILQYTKQIN